GCVGSGEDAGAASTGILAFAISRCRAALLRLVVARGVSVAGVAVTSGRGAARLTLRLRIGLARSGLIFCRSREWTITNCGGDGAVRLWITRRKLNRELPLTVLIETQRELAEVGVTDG